MPLFLTLLIAKSAAIASTALGRGRGSALPGLIAERLDANVGRKLADRLSRGSIVVTGTNGKTTTTKMLAEVMAADGREVITNRSGSNLSRGVVSALVLQSNVFGKPRGSSGLFEVDEASMPAVCAMVSPKTILVLNLFRDQLDRYGELDKTAKMIGAGITAATGADVILNADDPLVASLARYADGSVSYFGVEDAEVTAIATDLAADSDHCPICGRLLVFDLVFFGHIGHWSCPEGHFRRPNPETRVDLFSGGPDGSKLEMNIKGQRLSTNLKLPGLYNAYNALAAIAVASMVGIDVAKAVEAIARVDAAFGRVEKISLNGRVIYLLLIKNPTGFNQVIQTFLVDDAAPVLFIINDNFADGRDVSWLWDAGLETLAGRGHKLSVSGIRAYDMALRLKYAGMESAVEEDPEMALAKLIESTPLGGTAYVLPTYTAMLGLRRAIAKKSGLEKF